MRQIVNCITAAFIVFGMQNVSLAESSWLPLCPDNAQCSSGSTPFLDAGRVLLSPNSSEFRKSQWVSLADLSAAEVSIKTATLRLGSQHLLSLTWSGGTVYDEHDNVLYTFNQSGTDPFSLAIAGAATLGRALNVPNNNADILITGIVFSRNLFPAAIYQSRDEGRSWTAQTPNVQFRNNASAQTDVARLTTFVASPNGDSVWVVPGPTTAGLWRTPDRGDALANFDFTRLQRIDDGSFPRDVLLLRNARPTLFFPKGVSVAIADNGMYVSSDGGVTWKAGMFGGVVSDFVFAHNSTELQFVSARGGVFSSSDHGNTWIEMSRNLPTDDYSLSIAGQAIVGHGRIGTFVCRNTDCAGRAVGLPPGSSTGLLQAIEFHNTILDHYFLTTSASEATFIRTGGAGPGWTESGETFSVWPSSRFNTATSVCRFYGDPVRGPNSHFYSASSDECRQLLLLQDTTPSSLPQWHGEGYEFKVVPATNSKCPSDTTPIHRAYNNGASRGIDSNHRYVVNVRKLDLLLAAGWRYEGIAFCSPSQITAGG